MADKHDDTENTIPGTDETHPLPSDMREDGKDSTGGNAPFAPADITPVGDVEGGDSDKHDTTQQHEPHGSDD